MKGAYSLRFSRSAQTYDRWALPQRESARILAEFVKPEGTVLDLGCGTGFVSSFLPSGCEPVGLDLSKEMVALYRERFGRGIVGDAEELPFKDRSFDYVMSNFSLHWTDVKRSSHEALRVARKGVGIALPVEGSLEVFNFPFPEEDFVLSLFRGYETSHFVREIEVPFRGWDLVCFFHYTGSSLNPRRRHLLTREKILNLINSIEGAYFRMLFLYVRVV